MAVVVTSVLFGLAHWQTPGAGVQPLVMVTLAGVFLAGIVLVTRSLSAAWMAHLAWNWVMAALVHTDVSGVLPLPPPAYRVVETGPDLVTGGPWGPEGGIAAGAGLLAQTVETIDDTVDVLRRSVPDGAVVVVMADQHAGPPEVRVP